MSRFLFNVMKGLDPSTGLRMLVCSRQVTSEYEREGLDAVVNPSPSFDAVGGWIEAGWIRASGIIFYRSRDEDVDAWSSYLDVEIHDAVGLNDRPDEQVDLALIWKQDSETAGVLLHRVMVEGTDTIRFSREGSEASARLHLGKAFTVLT